MNRLLAIIDAQLCFWFCVGKGFTALIDQLDRDEMIAVLTPEQLARTGWTDYQ